MTEPAHWQVREDQRPTADKTGLVQSTENKKHTRSGLGAGDINGHQASA